MMSAKPSSFVEVIIRCNNNNNKSMMIQYLLLVVKYRYIQKVKRFSKNGFWSSFKKKDVFFISHLSLRPIDYRE